MSVNHKPQIGDKVWRELQLEEKTMGKGANGIIKKIDWSLDPREYIIIFSAPTKESGMVSRISLTEEELGYWTDDYGGTWIIGNITTF